MALDRRFRGVSDAVCELGPHWVDKFPARVKAVRPDGEFLWYVPFDEVEAERGHDAEVICGLDVLCRDLYADLEAAGGRVACYDDRMELLGVLLDD